MLELIFQGFIEWAYGLLLECWQYFSVSLLEIMSMDFAYLKSHIPIIPDLMQVFLAVGWALLLGNLVFQALKSMASGLGIEGEDPKLLFTRTFVFSFLLFASPQICEIGLSMTAKIIELLQIPDAIHITMIDESVFGALSASWLLVILTGAVIMFKVLRLLLEIAERYLILSVLTITAPLAFSMGGSKSTSEIFTGWCRMYGSMCLLMVTNVLFFKMLLSVLSTVPSGLDVLPWIVLVLTIVKVARKADAIITRIGLNPAITGGALGRGLPGALTYTVIRTATAQITKAAGKAISSPKGKAAGNPSPASVGAARMARSSAGPPSAGKNTYTQQSTAQQNTSEQTQAQGSTSQFAAQQGTAYQSAPQQNSIHHADTRQSSSQENTSAPTIQQSAKSGASGAPVSGSRKSAVPPGTRRSPTHIKTPATNPTSVRSGNVSSSGSAGKEKPSAAAYGASAYGTEAVHTLNTHKETGGSPAGVSPSGSSPSSTPQMQGARLSPLQSAPSKGQPPSKPESAGINPVSPVSRFTQAMAQRVHNGPVQSKIQSAAKTGIQVGQNTQMASQFSASNPSTPHTSNNTQAASSPAATRYSQRPAQSPAPVPAAHVSTEPVMLRQTTVTPNRPQHGHAEKMVSHASVHSDDGTHPGKNLAPSKAVSAGTRQQSPARQESRSAPVGTQSMVKGSISGQRHGPAGTVGSQRPAQQTRQTAKNISLGTPVTGTAPHKQASVNPTVAKPVNTGKPLSEKPARKQRGIKK